MKALYFEKYGSPEVLELREIPIPQPDNGEIRIKVHATTVTAADCLMRKSESIASRIILGIKKPRRKYRTLGLEFAGEVDFLGKGVTQFNPGERVYGFLGFTPGSYAEYICLSEKASLTRIPEHLSWNEAASLVDGATTALYFLFKKARVQKGQSVLIIGASGSIGSAALQLAYNAGAKVHGVCSSKNADYIMQLGAEKAIDYNQEDYCRSQNRYDIILDTQGKVSFSRSKGILNKKGKYIRCNGKILLNYLMNALYKFSPGKRFIFGMSVNKQDSLIKLNSLVEQGAIKPLIDKIYSLEETPQAHQYVEKGHKRGNVIIQVSR